MKRKPLLSLDEILNDATRVAVFEEIADSTNIGALFRSAAALNIDAVLITPTCCDPLCRRALRVSMGTVLQVPFTRISESGKYWIDNGIELLHSYGFKACAMALTDNSIGIEDERLNSEKKLAIILGTEGTGLSKSTIEKCDYTVKIPMSHGVDSLNVACAGAIAFFCLGKNKR
jgi:tRNA G18 (ribose-2'-O)-methylase SpoU